MREYLISPGQELTTDILGRYLQQFQSGDLPVLKKWRNYYNGRQKILFKEASDTGKPCNKVVTNFCKYITDTYSGYLTGVPVNYENDDMDNVLDILSYNDVVSEDNNLLKDALVYGRAFEINYVDEEGKQRFRTITPEGAFPIYDNTLNHNLLYVVRFWEEELNAEITPTYTVEVYGPATVRRYKSGAGFITFQLIEEVPHYYGQCPVSVFSLNKDEISIFAQIITLQDSYNEVLSGSVDDFDAFADAYLMLKGMTADEDDLSTMKTNRVLMMDTDCDAAYLTKDINDTQVSNLINNFKQNIHKIANCPDFTDESFMSQSGIAIRYKLTGMETTAANIEANMRKALQRRIELICAILNLTNEEQVWRDVDIIFTRNLPIETESIVSMVNSLRGLVSNRTLLAQLPFIKDVDEELKQLEAEKEANMSLYNFSNNELLEQQDNTGTINATEQ